MTGSDPKQIARELLEEAHPALIGLSHWIHANPELGYQEVLASGWVEEWLTTAGFEVRSAVGGMPTAVVGSYGPGPFHVAVYVEYDALPAVGHACGHNVIAAAGVGAGLALAAVADELGLRVTVMGTPAEETGGGKIGLIKAGELDGVHAAMMVHPWPQDEATPSIIAIRSLNVTYTGKEAHAAGFPYLGVNAADALVVAQTAIALLRQQLLPTDRVHGIVTKGGDAANIIPARTEATWMVRGTDVARLDQVTAMVRRCFEAGALATGAALHIVEEICYADVRHDPDLSRLYQQNGEALGRTFHPAGMPVSTDMGNVSYVVPSIHPMIGIAADGAVNHQADFAAACATPSADQAIFDGALALAWTAIDAAQDPALRERLMTFQPVPSEVEMVSGAWMMPPLAASAAAPAPVAAEPSPEAIAGALALGDQLSELIDGPMEGQVVVLAATPEDAADAALAEEAMPAEETELGGMPELVAEPWMSVGPEPEDETLLVDADADADIEPGLVAEPWLVVAEAAVVADAVADAGPDADAAAEVEPIADAWAVADAEPADADADVETPVEAAADAAPVAELDPDAAWAADVRAIEDQLLAVTASAAMAADAEPVQPLADATPAADAATGADEVTEVLFVGFDEPEMATTEAPAAEPTGDVLDVWVTPEVLGEWLETDASVTPAVLAASDADAGADVPSADLQPAAAVAPSAGATDLRDRSAWERAFESAATELGWQDQFEAALDERMTEEGMDRSEAMADLASDLQEGADADAALPPGWPPQATELVSRERIEAEGFSFVAPDLGNGDEPGDTWSRNGLDHASEDMSLR